MPSLRREISIFFSLKLPSSPICKLKIEIEGKIKCVNKELRRNITYNECPRIDRFGEIFKAQTPVIIIFIVSEFRRMIGVMEDVFPLF